MPLTPPTAPPVPSLNNPGAYNAQVEAGLSFVCATFIDWLRSLDAADWFDVLGTVAMTNGQPSGSLFERGSNANGRYVRMADGTQICSTNKLTLVATSSSSASVLWTYPAEFADADIAVTLTRPGAVGGSYTGISAFDVGSEFYNSLSAAAVSLGVVAQEGRSFGGSGQIRDCHAIAIGRGKLA